MPPGDDVIEQEIRIAAPPEVVFPFFTDPDKMRRWQGIDHKVDANRAASTASTWTARTSSGASTSK